MCLVKMYISGGAHLLQAGLKSDFKRCRDWVVSEMRVDVDKVRSVTILPVHYRRQPTGGVLLRVPHPHRGGLTVRLRPVPGPSTARQVCGARLLGNACSADARQDVAHRLAAAYKTPSGFSHAGVNMKT